ncbi:hypothetical protein ACFX14_005721 [Malus domestica]
MVLVGFTGTTGTLPSSNSISWSFESPYRSSDGILLLSLQCSGPCSERRCEPRLAVVTGTLRGVLDNCTNYLIRGAQAV